jgi:hypothetical protein
MLANVGSAFYAVNLSVGKTQLVGSIMNLFGLKNGSLRDSQSANFEI